MIMDKLQVNKLLVQSSSSVSTATAHLASLLYRPPSQQSTPIDVDEEDNVKSVNNSTKNQTKKDAPGGGKKDQEVVNLVSPSSSPGGKAVEDAGSPEYEDISEAEDAVNLVIATPKYEDISESSTPNVGPKYEDISDTGTPTAVTPRHDDISDSSILIVPQKDVSNVDEAVPVNTEEPYENISEPGDIEKLRYEDISDPEDGGK